MTTAKPTQDNAWGEAWGEATRRLAAGEARLVGLWADGARSAHGAVGGAAGTRVLPLRRRRRLVSLGRRGACAGDPPRARDRRPQRAEGARRARSRGLGSTMAAGRSAIRSGDGAPADGGEPERYAFLGAEGVGLHQIPVGPVHAGIIEPGHFRFHASGETIVRLEARLGYVHKGVERLMAGADLARGARARRPGQRRQHGRLPDRLRPRRRSGERNRRAAAGGVAEGADGRDRARRQSPRRHRRDLQRRLVRADARPYRRVARADAARRRRMLSATG